MKKRNFALFLAVIMVLGLISAPLVTASVEETLCNQCGSDVDVCPDCSWCAECDPYTHCSICGWSEDCRDYNWCNEHDICGICCDEHSHIRVMLNYEYIEFDQEPIIQNGRTLEIGRAHV